jgi:2-succinyl-6-hydroxy-2,4-cyclohexadiene-1-carboxylate synthase
VPEPLRPVSNDVSLVTPPRLVSDQSALLTPVVALHGFTQTGASWQPILGALSKSTGRAVSHPDLAGHGLAGNERPTGLHDAAAHLVQRVDPEPSIWIGYSLGGRVLLHLALAFPSLVRALILVSSTAGIDDDAERAARCRADNLLADHLESVGVVPFVNEWLAQPMFARLPASPDDLAARRANTSAGLASSLRTCGTGTQDPLWDRLVQLSMPTLVVTGTNDAKFTNLGTRLAAAIPSARHEQLSDAGHSCHLEKPTEFTATIEQFLAEIAG